MFQRCVESGKASKKSHLFIGILFCLRLFFVSLLRCLYYILGDLSADRLIMREVRFIEAVIDLSKVCDQIPLKQGLKPIDFDYLYFFTKSGLRPDSIKTRIETAGSGGMGSDIDNKFATRFH